MATEKQLRDTLVLAFEHLKEQRVALTSALVEVASLRDSLCQLGSNYAHILHNHRENHKSLSGEVLNEALLKFDSIIQRLKDDDFS